MPKNGDGARRRAAVQAEQISEAAARPWLSQRWPTQRSRIRIYYEGNVIGHVNLNRFRERVVQAATRMLHNCSAGYPTQAREELDEREVAEVGSIETDGYRLPSRPLLPNLSGGSSRATLLT